MLSGTPTEKDEQQDGQEAGLMAIKDGEPERDIKDPGTEELKVPKPAT